MPVRTGSGKKRIAFHRGLRNIFSTILHGNSEEGPGVSMNPRELEREIVSLLRQPMPDARLREQLERLAAAEISFPGFTWLWGPELYRRNRVLFRPFIHSRFSSYVTLPKWKVESIPWKGDRAKVLDAWLSEVDRNDDADLFRGLYEWRLAATHNRQARDSRSREIGAELLARLRHASGAARRQVELRKFDLRFQLDEETACGLYALDPHAAGPFILNHLPSGWISGAPKRKLWSGLLDLASRSGDEGFRWKLYRRQVPLDEWTKDCLELCNRVSDGAALVLELEKRHPEGWGLNLAEGFYAVVRHRGADVLPYVMRHLRQARGGLLRRGSYGKMADYARRQGWWGFWAALVRACSGRKEFNREVRAILESKSLPEEDAVERLSALAGVSREWNLPGLGLATAHQLDEPAALLLYDRFPDLLRGPYKLHAQPLWGSSYPKLLDRFLAAGDEEMIDHLASRLVTRPAGWGGRDGLADVERLAGHYAGLKRMFRTKKQE